MSYDYNQYAQAPPAAKGPDPYAGYSAPPPSGGGYPGHSAAPPPAGSYPPPQPAYGSAPPAYGGSYSYNAPPPAYGAPPPYAYPPSYGAPPGPGGPGAGDVRTIFITGFPADVKERELNNLLRFLGGYEASQMNWKNGQAQGFALFSTPGHARAACDAITQLCFDDASVLRCEMARKDMHISNRTEDPNAKRPRTAAPGSYPPPSSYAPPSYGGAPSSAPRSYAPVSNTGDNPPCDTLFVGNLGDQVSEPELLNIFSGAPGFRQLKLVRGKNTTCFVQFDSAQSAQQVHSTQQGVVLQSSDRGPIRIQFSKNPFGKKRDVNGSYIDVSGGRGAAAAAPSAEAFSAALAAVQAAADTTAPAPGAQ